MLLQFLGHRKKSCGVHVGRHDGHTTPSFVRMAELEIPRQSHIRSGNQRTALRSYQNVIKGHFHVMLYTH